MGCLALHREHATVGSLKDRLGQAQRGRGGQACNLDPCRGHRMDRLHVGREHRVERAGLKAAHHPVIRPRLIGVAVQHFNMRHERPLRPRSQGPSVLARLQSIKHAGKQGAHGLGRRVGHQAFEHGGELELGEARLGAQTLTHLCALGCNLGQGGKIAGSDRPGALARRLRSTEDLLGQFALDTPHTRIEITAHLTGHRQARGRHANFRMLRNKRTQLFQALLESRHDPTPQSREACASQSCARSRPCTRSWATAWRP